MSDDDAPWLTERYGDLAKLYAEQHPTAQRKRPKPKPRPPADTSDDELALARRRRALDALPDDEAVAREARRNGLA